MDHREELFQRSIPFLHEVKAMTPGAAIERLLIEKYGEDSDLHKNLARLIEIAFAAIALSRPRSEA
jgi:hypothetical protein